MEQKNHIHDREKLPGELEKLQVSLEVPYEKSREEVWEAIQQKIVVKEAPIHRFRPTRKRLWLTAASVVILMGMVALLRFYHRTIRTAPGQMVTLTLPDGSTAVLNAQSRLTYYPLWWRISAKVTLTGEAFFKGHHSRSFTVKSERGTVAVLGTSFDIYARHDNYRVVCFTGEIRVTSRTKKQIILLSGEKAVVSQHGDITFSKTIKTHDYNAWTKHQFVFTAMPLSSVLDELARRYNVKIELRKRIRANYTGNFSADIPVEQALNIVCKPFGLTFVTTDHQHFIIQ